MALALFDLDETLLPIDSDYLWSVFMVKKGYIDDKEFMVKKDIFKQEYMQGRLDIYKYIAFMANYLNRLGVNRDSYQEEFIQEVIRKKITPQALALVRKHREAGDVTVIITATNEFIVKDIFGFFEVDYLISSEMETEVRDGKTYYTGRSLSTPSFQEGKVKRVEEFLVQHPECSWQGSFFYSDSRNDLSLLKKVDYPKVVNPDPVLREQAKLNGWEIIDLHERHILEQ